MTVAIVTDSNSQLPDEIAGRYGIAVVPLTVTVDGVDHAEGVDLSADEFYGRYRDGASPEVATAAPAPGRFLEAYERAAAAGATEILSIHISESVSATIGSARIAAEMVDVPVRVVDTGTASFGISCCVWEAASVLAAGGSSDDAVAAATSTAPTVGNVFVVGALDIVRAGGRLAVGTEVGTGTPILSLVDGAVEAVGRAADVTAATQAMVEHIASWGTGLRVAVGVADRDAAPLSAALADACRARAEVVDVVDYRIGPSVGAHTGPGTAGAFFWPTSA